MSEADVRTGGGVSGSGSLCTEPTSKSCSCERREVVKSANSDGSVGVDVRSSRQWLPVRDW